MEKSINLQIEDFKQELLSVINKSNMPITVTEIILQGILTECTIIKKQELIRERKEYEENKESVAKT